MFCWLQVLADTCENLYKAGLKDPFYQPVRTYVLNPKSITMGELYGEVNKLTMEWRDGLMAMTVRKAVQVELHLYADRDHDFSRIICSARLRPKSIRHVSP